MATRYIVLPTNQPTLPDGSGSGNNAPDISQMVSSGSQTTNTPKTTAIEWLFDAGTDEHLMWNFHIPGDYQSGGVVRVTWRSNSTISGATVWKAAQATGVLGSTVESTIVFSSVITGTSTVPGTLNQSQIVALSLPTTNMASNRRITVMIGRDADNGSDTMTGDATLQSAIFEYEAL